MSLIKNLFTWHWLRRCNMYRRCSKEKLLEFLTIVEQSGDFSCYLYSRTLEELDDETAALERACDSLCNDLPGCSCCPVEKPCETRDGCIKVLAEHFRRSG